MRNRETNIVFACTITQWQNLQGPFWVPNGKVIRKKDYLSTQNVPLDDLQNDSMFRLYIRKKFLTMKMVRHMNRFCRGMVDAPLLAKARLDGAFCSLV